MNDRVETERDAERIKCKQTHREYIVNDVHGQIGTAFYIYNTRKQSNPKRYWLLWVHVYRATTKRLVNQIHYTLIFGQPNEREKERMKTHLAGTHTSNWGNDNDFGTPWCTRDSQHRWLSAGPIVWLVCITNERIGFTSVFFCHFVYTMSACVRFFRCEVRLNGKYLSEIFTRNSWMIFKWSNGGGHWSAVQPQ